MVEKSMSNFVNDCINGDALLTDIHDYIDLWHDSESNLSLHEFLGMSKSEYSLFIKGDEYLAYIIIAHMQNKDIFHVVEYEISLAARADNHNKAKVLEQWLKNEGLWD